VLADPRVARWLVLKFFHLMGFRRRETEGRQIVFERRHEGPFDRQASAASV
jgi:hypothetical protein